MRPRRLHHSQVQDLNELEAPLLLCAMLMSAESRGVGAALSTPDTYTVAQQAGLVTLRRQR